MTLSVVKFEVRKDGSQHASRAYAVRDSLSNDLTCFDVTRELEALDREDAKDGHDSERGPKFGFGIHNALIAVRAHGQWSSVLSESNITDMKVKVPFKGSWRTFSKSATKVVREWSW
jgi:hypothetical protein